MTVQMKGLAYRTACQWASERPSAINQAFRERAFLKGQTSAPYWHQPNDERWFIENPNRQYRARTADCMEIEEHSGLTFMWNLQGQRMLLVIVSRNAAAPIRHLVWSRRWDLLEADDATLAALLDYQEAYVCEGDTAQ